MKKIFNYLVSFLAISLALVACKKEEPTPDPTPVGGGFKVNEVVAAASAAYSAWEDAREIPATFTVAGKTLSTPDFFFVEATALVEISEGSTAEIAVVPYKAAAAPDKDSYDATEIAVTNGPKDGKGVAEDVVTIAKTFLADAAAKGQWQNRALVYRGDDALAFCTNRAIVTVMRALAEYAEAAKLPAKVSTEYLSASNTLKAFAQEFVKYLPIWEATIADKLSADGSHCSSNNNAWERVHFIPIPYDTDNDYHNEGKDQYDFAKYGNPQNIEVNGVTYTAANCWEIAIRGLMDMCTTDGQAFMNTMDRNTPINYGDGLSLMSAPISKPSDACVWGKYPWYESTSDGGFIKYNGETITEMNVDLLLKACSWHVTRSFISNSHNTPLGMIGNFQQFGTDPSTTLVYEGHEGLISPMREFLIMARIYKHLLDNNINKNVYTAIKDLKFDADLYNQQLPVNVKTKSVTFEATPEGPKTIELTAAENWTATCDAEWITLDPASGAAGDATVTVTAQNNTAAEARTATITFAAGDYTKDVAVTQTEYVAPITGTLKEFAQEFVKALDVWAATVGTVDADGTHNGATAWTNVHLIPIENPAPGYTNPGNQYDDELYPVKFTVTVDGQTYTSSQAWEIAQRGLLDLVTKEGSAELVNFNDSRNHAMTLSDGASLLEPMPSFTPGCKWGGNPWYEYDNTVTYNGGEIESVGVDFMVKVGAWHVVRSFIKTDCNSPLGNIGNFQEFGESSSTLNLAGYVGYIAPMREFLILARFYKYLLDNNITENVYTAVKDQKFDFDLYNQGAAPVVKATLKDFAEAYVSCLDVWQSTIGMVEADGKHCVGNGTQFENVHLVPIANPNKGYTTEGNQYDDTLYPVKWTVKVGETEYTSAQAWEIAIRGLMELCTAEGEAFLPGMTDRNMPYTLANGKALSTTVPEYTDVCEWGSYPWYEEDRVVTNDGAEVKEVGIDFILKCGSWFVVRGLIDNSGNSRLGKIGNFQEFGTSSSQLNLDKYEGLISPMREMLLAARVYKYLLDNNITENVYDAIKDVKVAYDLY